jgi:hypothetical protein
VGPRPVGGYKGCNAKLVLVTRASRFRDNDIASLILFNSLEVPRLPEGQIQQYLKDVWNFRYNYRKR